MATSCPDDSLLIECPFCRAHFRQSLHRAQADHALLCPNCASMEELDAQELRAIVAAASVAMKVPTGPE